MLKENKNGIFKNIIGTIIEPRAALERVSEKPRIFAYLMPIIVVQLIIAIIELPKIISFTILKAQETQNFSQNSIPSIKKIATIGALIASALSPVILALIATILIKFIAMFSQESGKFKNLFCVNILAYIPMVISGVLGAIIITFTEPENIKNITTSLTLFLNSSISETSTIYKLFSCIDFFVIWSLILVSIGTSVVFKMKMKKSSLMVFGIYIVAIVIKVII